LRTVAPTTHTPSPLHHSCARNQGATFYGFLLENTANPGKVGLCGAPDQTTCYQTIALVENSGNFPVANATSGYECFGENNEITNNTCTNENVGSTAISLQITVQGGPPVPPTPPPTPPAQCVDQPPTVAPNVTQRK